MHASHLFAGGNEPDVRKSAAGDFFQVNNMAEAHTIHVDIVSAEGEIFSGEAVMVFAPASEGDLGIAPRHAPLLTLLKPGEVRVQTPDGQQQHFFVGGGALEVQPNKITVLADTAVRAHD